MVTEKYRTVTNYLHGNQSKCICYRAKQDNCCKYRAKVFDHKVKNLFPAESSAFSYYFLLNLSTPTFLEIKRQVASAAIGIITELVRKSKKSRNCIPMIFTKPSGPYPREERVPRRIMITPTITVAFFLCHLSSSWKVDTALSVRAIELVRAAHSTSTKNRIPMGVPNPILANTFGMVMNISAGPACKVSGSPPENANTAGMIIRPAIMAIAVSNTSTFLVEPSIDTSFFHIRAKGYQNSHGNRQGIKHLTHGGYHCHPGEILNIWYQEIFHSCKGTWSCNRVNSNKHR